MCSGCTLPYTPSCTHDTHTHNTHTHTHSPSRTLAHTTHTLHLPLSRPVTCNQCPRSLDVGLREACEEDLEKTCSSPVDEIENDEKRTKTAINCLQVGVMGGRLVLVVGGGSCCLVEEAAGSQARRVCVLVVTELRSLPPKPRPPQTFKDELKSSECKDKVRTHLSIRPSAPNRLIRSTMCHTPPAPSLPRTPLNPNPITPNPPPPTPPPTPPPKVHRMMMRASRDIRFDDLLAKACREDRRKFCDLVQPVGFDGVVVGRGEVVEEVVVIDPAVI